MGKLGNFENCLLNPVFYAGLFHLVLEVIEILQSSSALALHSGCQNVTNFYSKGELHYAIHEFTDEKTNKSTFFLDNAIFMERNNELCPDFNSYKSTMICWLVLNNVMLFAAVVLIWSVFLSHTPLLEFFLRIPWFIMVSVITVLDWYMLANWLYSYRHHRSKMYFLQFFGRIDFRTEDIIRERHNLLSLENIGRSKLSMLSHRSICHVISVCFLVLIIYFHSKPLKKPKLYKAMQKLRKERSDA